MASLLVAFLTLSASRVMAYSSGPDPGVTGAPGNQTCAQAGCHTGTALNGGGGNVAITFPNGTTYTPGVRQRWTITITDSAARAYGFQATARLESNVSAAQAGTFSNADSSTWVQCANGTGSPRPAAGCPTTASIEYIQHTGPSSNRTFTIEWTPPATDSGNVRVFIAANAANGNGTNAGDRIYTANYTLTPTAATPQGERPAIRSGGVTDAFSGASGVSPQAWVTLAGTNFATDTLAWDRAIQGNKLPTELGGVAVSVNDKPAAIGYVSPTQVNVLVPPDIGTGDVRLLARNSIGDGEPVTVQAANVRPALFAPGSQEDRRYVIAMTSDGVFVGKTGTDSRVTRGARKGELLVLFGTGFGPTRPAVAANETITGTPAVTLPVRIRFGETVARVVGTGALIAPGIFQFQVIVPDGVSAGDVPVIAEIDGVVTTSNALLTIEP